MRPPSYHNLAIHRDRGKKFHRIGIVCMCVYIFLFSSHRSINHKSKWIQGYYCHVFCTYFYQESRIIRLQSLNILVRSSTNLFFQIKTIIIAIIANKSSSPLQALSIVLQIDIYFSYFYFCNVNFKYNQSIDIYFSIKYTICFRDIYISSL